MTFTKEQLIAAAHGRIDFANMMLSDNPESLKERTWSIELELARIALSALRERAEPEFYGPYTPVMIGAGVWVSIADELPPHLEGRKVWVITRHPDPETVTRELLRAVVDAAWKHATESEEVPATTWADSIIDDVLSSAPPAPVVPDAATAIRACLEEFPESVHDIVEECAAIAENACRAAMLQPVSQPYKLPVSPQDESKPTKN
ncbi:hypothetical protein ACVS9X_001430 [Cronobacter malonaticus]